METSPNNLSDRRFLAAAFIGAAALAVSLPVYVWGIPYGNDLPQHYQFALQFENALENGVLYPAWGAGTNSGLGDVGVRFYPPLPSYALVAFKLLTGNWYTGSAFAFWFWFCLGGFGVYFLSREWVDSQAAVAGAIVYTLLPYHVNQIYNAFFYAEFAGAAVLPFCFLFVARLAKERATYNVAGLAAASAALVLTHLPTAIMAAIAVTVFAVIELRANWQPKVLIAFASAALLGAAASSFYWIKLVSELAFLSHARAEFSETTFSFNSNFLFAYFYVGADDYVTRSLWFGDLILLLTVGIIAAAVINRWFAGHREYRTLASWYAVVAVSVFFATPLSAVVWETLGPLQKIQFPFRFLSVISIAAAVVMAISVNSFFTVLYSQKRPLALVSAGLLSIAVVFSFSQVIRPAMFVEEAKFKVLLTELPGRKSCECWWPVWADPSALVSLSLNEPVGSLATRVNGAIGSTTLYAGAGGTSAGVFYYPNWRLSAGGEYFDVVPDRNGMISIPEALAAGPSELVFEEAGQVRAAQIVSLLGWFAVLILFGASAAGSRQRDHS